MVWATRGLVSGDMTALQKLARGGTATEAQVKRLKMRGFIRNSLRGKPQVTFLGHIALFMKRFG